MTRKSHYRNAVLLLAALMLFFCIPAVFGETVTPVAPEATINPAAVVTEAGTAAEVGDEPGDQTPATEAETALDAAVDEALPAAPLEGVPGEVLPPARIAEEEVEKPRIAAIEITGNKRVPTEEIESRIASQVGEVYDPERIEKDRVAIRDLGWFTHVQATTFDTEEGVRIVFRVVENEIIKEIQLFGVTVDKPDRQDLLALMQSKPGEVANQRYVAQDIGAIEQAYAEQGYVLAQVGEREITEEGVLRLMVLEGTITEISITGNKETKTYVIERELRSKPGDVYNAQVMRKDLSRIFNLGFFDDVRAHPEVGTEPGTVILVVEVVERERTGLASFGGGWGSVSGMVFTVDVSKDNWRGTGQRISVRGQFGGISSYEAAYYNPWIAANHTSLNVSGYNRLVLREAFKDNGDSFTYDERRIGGGLTIGRPFGEVTRGFVSVRRDDLRIEDIDDEEATLEDVLFKDQSVRSVSLGLIRDTRDLAASPTRGGRSSLTVETAGLVGGANFNKYTTDLRRYFSFGDRPKDEDIAALRKRKVIAVRLLAGTTTGSPPFLEQFLLGGGETLRGYQQDRFPGKNLLLLNVEYRFPVTDTLQGVFFVDSGDAWGGDFAEEFGDSEFTTHSSVGVGIQVQSPIGPLRLHYGLGSEGGQVHFGIGQTF